MRQDKRNLMFLIITLVLAVFSSYLLFVSGVTSKLSASANKMTASLDNSPNTSDYPVITMVFNSSGEKLVNSDIALTIESRSDFRIDKVYYSFDRENWIEGAKGSIEKDKTTFKIIFEETMNEKVYIIVENEKGYRSYPYETIVNIDKDEPQISVNNYFDKLIINASDNNELYKIQYSNDKKIWEEKEINGKEVSLNGERYSYVRVVDTAGNISKIKKIEN